MNIKKRIEDVRKVMGERQVDCLILAPSTDLYYVTGFCGLAMERPIFLIVRQEDACFILPRFEADNLQKEIKEQIPCILWQETEDPYEKAAACIGNKKLRIAAGDTMPNVMAYRLARKMEQVTWRLGQEVMEELRATKDATELEALTAAQQKSETALSRTLKQGLAGYTEREVALRLKGHLEEEGLVCQGMPLVASGQYGAMPHHQAEDIKICPKDAVIIDFGGSYEGYYSDITRTAAVGKPPEGFEEVYEIVRAANETAFKKAKPGVPCESLDESAREIIREAGYGQFFTHRLGHGIGLDIHEPPYIVAGNRSVLQEGNVFSNEPGIYLPGRFGVRLEDDLYVGPEEARCLTGLGHEILIVD
ncbi:M24 family metallopeptidase [Dorea sp. D27]|uniref:M24 family metallopeptidase n=1 Tax=Dorea sp. D27 TaxID=658665 RepID=UPI000673B3B0|nr:aminopeptidase P family protein [Dorea sp. D27]KMZ53472.1 Xaa-Pro dipeptidase [Dorea sp. D27]